MAVETLFGTNAQRAFFGTIFIQAVVVLVMVGITFRLVEEHVPTFNTTRYKTLPCYLALFALAEIFELLMAWDALRLRNVIQLIGILLFQASLIVFASLQVEQTHSALVIYPDCPDNDQDRYLNCGGPGTLWNNVEHYLIVAPCIIAASWLALMFWVRKLYSEFGWAIFHVVGANPKMKSMYQWYQIMVCLLKFDFFFFVGVTMQLLIVVLNRNSAEFGVTIAAIPVVLILLALCGYALQREIKWVMSVSLGLMIAAMGYLFKLVRIHSPSTKDQYIGTSATLTTFLIVAFGILFATFAVGLRCFADFDKGLQASKTHDVTGLTKGSIPLSSTAFGDGTERQSSYIGGAPITNRISIE